MTEHVLVVEDNRALAENVKEMLQDEGVEVSVRYDAPSAELTAHDQGFDLAIVDIRLAGGASGLELVPRLRRQSPHGEILLMTGHATIDSALQAIRRGVYGYLVKPFEPEHLISMVKRALAQVALRREKQSLAARLASSEALYRGVVETVEACILGLDREGIIRFCNRFAAERTGFTQGELAGRPFSELCADGRSRALFARILAGQALRDEECDLKVRDGSVRTMRWTVTPLDAVSLEGARHTTRALSEAAAGPMLLAAGIDITERLLLERKSAEAEALAAMGTLTTALAHEIRNPLNAAKLQLELIVRRARRAGSPELQELISQPAQLVRTEIDRLASLLDEFLELARPRGIERSLVRVTELFEEVLSLQQPLIASAQVAVAMHVEPAQLEVRADADKLKQVLINLLANAVDALREHPQPRRVELSAEARANGAVSMRVADNGPGIPSEVAGDEFTPFVTSKRGGTGLGLSIVRKIIQQHGGDIQLTAREPHGTVAGFFIPA